MGSLEKLQKKLQTCGPFDLSRGNDACAPGGIRWMLLSYMTRIPMRIHLACVLFLLIIPLAAHAQELPDLDVTYIERTPRYARYVLDYTLMPGDPFRVPRLCAGTENDKHEPDPGETITYTAHIKNKGGASSVQAGFVWTVNGTVVDQGVSGPL